MEYHQYRPDHQRHPLPALVTLELRVSVAGLPFQQKPPYSTLPSLEAMLNRSVALIVSYIDVDIRSAQ